MVVHCLALGCITCCVSLCSYMAIVWPLYSIAGPALPGQVFVVTCWVHVHVCNGRLCNGRLCSSWWKDRQQNCKTEAWCVWYSCMMKWAHDTGCALPYSTSLRQQPCPTTIASVTTPSNSTSPMMTRSTSRSGSSSPLPGSWSGQNSLISALHVLW